MEREKYRAGAVPCSDNHGAANNGRNTLRPALCSAPQRSSSERDTAIRLKSRWLAYCDFAVAMRFRTFIFALIGCVSVAAHAAASPIVDFEFLGQVEAGTSFIPSLPLGTNVQFIVPFDYGAADSCPSAGSGQYFFPGGTISYDGVSYTSQFTSLCWAAGSAASPSPISPSRPPRSQRRSTASP